MVIMGTKTKPKSKVSSVLKEKPEPAKVEITSDDLSAKLKRKLDSIYIRDLELNTRIKSLVSEKEQLKIEQAKLMSQIEETLCLDYEIQLTVRDSERRFALAVRTRKTKKLLPRLLVMHGVEPETIKACTIVTTSKSWVEMKHLKAKGENEDTEDAEDMEDDN